MVLWLWEYFVESVVVLASGHIEPVVMLANGHVESVVVVANRHVESGKFEVVDQEEEEEVVVVVVMENMMVEVLEVEQQVELQVEEVQYFELD